MEELITSYFNKGYSYNEIVNFLNHSHGITISLRTLKSRLRSYGLRRRGNYTDNHIETVVQSVIEHIRINGNTHGYRYIWHMLRLNGVTATRDLVMMILKQLDPEGADLRRRKTLIRRSYYSKGPNWVWHVDGYDKLKPFGFPIQLY